MSSLYCNSRGLQAECNTISYYSYYSYASTPPTPPTPPTPLAPPSPPTPSAPATSTTPTTIPTTSHADIFITKTITTSRWGTPRGLYKSLTPMYWYYVFYTFLESSWAACLGRRVQFLKFCQSQSGPREKGPTTGPPRGGGEHYGKH